eukprot:SAG31_NODE_1459_length_8254_cov_4.297854_10_plen_86_part_00
MPKGERRSSDHAAVRDGQQYIQRIDSKKTKDSRIGKSRKSTAPGPRRWGTRKWCLEHRVEAPKRKPAAAVKKEASAVKAEEGPSK